MRLDALRRALLPGLVAVLFAPSAQAALTALDAYVSGGALCIVVRNDGAAPATLEPGPLRRDDTAFVVPVWWAHAEPAAVGAGQLALVRYGLRRVAPLHGMHTATLGGESVRVVLDTDAAENAIAITHLAAAPARREATLFIQNLGGDALAIDAIEIAGEPVGLDRERSDAEILACETGLAIATNGPPFAGEQPVIVMISTGARSIYRHAPPFTSPSFRVRMGEVPDALICPTHRHGPWDDVARGLMAAPLPPEVHFCRNRTHEGLAALAQLSPRSIVNLQGSNRARGKADAWAGLRAFTAYATGQVSPGILSALVEPNSNFDGGFAQPTAAKTDLLTPRDLQYTVFAALAGGCNGLVFRMGEQAGTEYAEMAKTLAASLESARPWLEDLVPVSLGIVASDPSVVATTHYAGPSAALVILLRDAPQEEPSALSVRLDVPRWFTPTQQRSLGAGSSTLPLPQPVERGALALEFDGFRDVAAVLLFADTP